jgi:hypothetical protein
MVHAGLHGASDEDADAEKTASAETPLEEREAVVHSDIEYHRKVADFACPLASVFARVCLDQM